MVNDAMLRDVGASAAAAAADEEAEAADAYAAFDRAAGHVGKRLRRYRRRVSEHARAQAGRARADDSDAMRAVRHRRKVARDYAAMRKGGSAHAGSYACSSVPCCRSHWCASRQSGRSASTSAQKRALWSRWRRWQSSCATT